MLIKTVRMSKLRAIAMLILSVALIAVLIALIPTYAATTVCAADGSKVYTGVKNNNDRIRFLEQLGWEVSSEPNDTVNVTVPNEFDEIISGYNKLQLDQGLDLTKYRKKTVTRYTYTVTNYPDYDGTVLATLLVYRGKVIGGDICSAEPTGFIHGFVKPSAEE